MSQTCVTCKHWSQTSKELGSCSMPSIDRWGETHHSPTAFSLVVNVPPGYKTAVKMVTGAQFFCLFWESEAVEE